MNVLRHAVAPVIRLATVHDVSHGPVFEAFAQHLGRALVDERVRNEPRVVSFRARAVR